MTWIVRLKMFLHALIDPSVRGDLFLVTAHVTGPGGKERIVERLYNGWGREQPLRRDKQGRLLCPGCGKPVVEANGKVSHPGPRHRRRQRKRRR